MLSTASLRMLLPVLVSALLLIAPSAGAQRVTSGLAAYYPFTEGSGTTVRAQWPSPLALDMELEGSVSWLAGQNGILLSGGFVTSGSPATPLIQALQATSQSSFEVWIATANTVQTGHIVDIENGGEVQNFAFAQGVFGLGGDDVLVSLVHTGKNAEGQPRLVTTDSFLTTALTHLVHTYDGAVERLYVNGVQHPTTVTSAGDYSNWDVQDALKFANGTEGNSPWLGTMRLVAIYDRALTSAEVSQNFAAGADVPPPPDVDAGPDIATPELPGAPALVASLNGTVTDDGLPDPPGFVTTNWSLFSGPGSVTFGDPAALQTTATFTVPGVYVLRLTGDDGASVGQDFVTVTVDQPSAQVSATNVFPADLATDVSTTPVLEVDCSVQTASVARYVIATDAGFTNVVHDSGATVYDPCHHVAFAGLTGLTQHFWSARLRDDAGLWSSWSAPTAFTTIDPARVSVVSLQDGVAGYAGGADADIRGSFQDPTVAIFEYNQGAQDVLRTGRRPQPAPTDEIFRSLLRFDAIPVTEPTTVVNVYLELTGWQHAGAPVEFDAPNSFYRLLIPWAEGTGVERNVQTGEVSWTYSELPTAWTTPGASAPGADRDPDPVMRGTFKSGEIGHKTFWSSGDFLQTVKDWIANPASNHGLLFQADDESIDETLNIASREVTDPSFHPRLVIEVLTACGDGIDNDGDGHIDFDGAGGSDPDPGCASLSDLAETNPIFPCDDGVDNDGDGLIDVAEDPACLAPLSASENPQCDDDLDNDGDGGIDWDGGSGGGSPDSNCIGKPESNREKNSSCGIGIELVGVLLPLMALRRRRRGR